MAEPLIRTSGLTKRYGSRTVVDGLDLEVHPGEIYGLLGPNGAGKTTTILMLLGLTEPSEGEARVVGLDPARHPVEVKRRVGYLPDDAGFYPDLTGRQNLRYTAALNGLRDGPAEERVSGVLERVGLAEAADQPAGQYSRGMRQRLGIADALLKQPSVLILDEPTIGIDPLGVAEILALVRRLASEQRIGLLLASHLLDQVQATCDRVGIFSEGQLVGEGTVAELGVRFGGGRSRLVVGFEPAAGSLDESLVERVLRSIAGVAAYRPAAGDGPDRSVAAGGSGPGVAAWVVELDKGAEASVVRRDLVRAVGQAGLPLAELRVVVPSLGEIYRSAVASTRPIDDAGGASPGEVES